jgi:hypothetical protein
MWHGAGWIRIGAKQADQSHSALAQYRRDATLGMRRNFMAPNAIPVR